MDHTQLPVGRRVQALREHHALTLEELAELAGLHYTTISKLEKGTTPYVHVTTAHLLAEALYVPVSALFDPEDMTTLGKPAQATSGKYERRAKTRATCPSCHLELLPCGLCPSECTPRHTEPGDEGSDR
jgi:transcriptional regulator with XRE-family HTH domain